MSHELKLEQTRQQQLQHWINQETDFTCQGLNKVSDDASFRRYFRFLDKAQWIIAVDAPPQYEDCSKFVAVAKSYRAAKITVPKVYGVDVENGFYLQEDFGDRQFSAALNSNSCHQLYKKALACIPAIQSCVGSEQGAFAVYDRAFVSRELNIFGEWLLTHYLNMDLSDVQSQMIQQSFTFISEIFLQQPTAGVHRDFHSRNLMLLAQDEIGIIDFQDAVVGPITYDAVSLLRDCYQYWPQALVYTWLKEWHGQHFHQYDWLLFKAWFDVTGMQRHIKASGIFARLAIRDNKPKYLIDIPRTLAYIVEVGRQIPQLQDFANFVSEQVLPRVLDKHGADLNND
jgi:aminoglycoside/choline kinase family phosphotransferase